MKAFILAGGLGTRLKSLTDKTPKPLLPVCGKPIIDYIIDNLNKSGIIDEIVVIAKYKSEQFIEHFKGNKQVKVLIVNGEKTADSIKEVFEKECNNEALLLCFGDVLTDIDVKQLIEAHQENKKQGAVVTVGLNRVSIEDARRIGVVTMDKNKITMWYSTATEGAEESTIGDTTYAVLEPQFNDYLEIGKPLCKHTWKNLALDKKLFGLIMKPTYWIDIGTPESYEKAQNIISKLG